MRMLEGSLYMYWDTIPASGRGCPIPHGGVGGGHDPIPWHGGSDHGFLRRHLHPFVSTPAAIELVSAFSHSCLPHLQGVTTAHGGSLPFSWCLGSDRVNKCWVWTYQNDDEEGEWLKGRPARPRGGGHRHADVLSRMTDCLPVCLWVAVASPVSHGV